MTEYESAIIGYALNTKNPLPVLRLSGKFSEQRLNALAALAQDSPFDLLNIYEKCVTFKIDVSAAELAGMINSSMIIDSTIEAYIEKVESDFAVANAKRILAEATMAPITKDSIADLSAALASAAFVERDDPSISHAIEQLEEEQEAYVEAVAHGRQFVGHETGIFPLDCLTNGIRKNHLWVISAATSAGKTTLALNMIHNMLGNGIKVVFYSLEMSRSQLYSRLLALESGMSMSEVETCGVDEKLFEQYKAAREESKKWDLRIYFNRNRIEDIIVSMKEESLRGAQVFVIDYLQNIVADSAKSEYEQITREVQEIQRTTISLPISTILVSQISNEDAREGKLLSVGGKGSGAVKAAADLFGFLKNKLEEKALMDVYRTGEPVPMTFVISKQRHGKVGAVDLLRDQRTGKIRATH